MATESPLSALAHRARIGKFLSVGALGASIETLVVALLTTTAGIGPLAAKAVGAELSISTMFLVNDRWTFAAAGNAGARPALGRWGRSHLVRAVGLGVGFAVLFGLTRPIEATLPIAGVDLWPTVANGIGICVGMTFNYVAESLVTWDVG
ncbi:GtrA family protein [Halohasta salina]|uniref:GtrA family protein n=1 Tax=Halohasta salina TaxID=2961621 RepID=UPI0020A4F52C|nr:GtrA family protein [Halohasta salina]